MNVFNYQRKSWNGYSMPTRLLEELVLVRNFTRQTKYIDGRESTVSTNDLVSPAYEDIENGLSVNYTNLYREVGAPSIDYTNHMSTHARSSTDLPQSQEEEPVNDQSDAKDPMTITKSGEDLNTSNELSVFDFLPQLSRRGRIITRSKRFNY
ncbi:hypothetical protein GJ496_005423 [Pomphorhynchus laevis]|nr:hypothetical protein GJ496_011420 [Pomphorhynchus laevis]KAI0990679.1 hypothetical protein GJ496_005423 [Pomphorhynchus laevis]